MCVQDMNFSVAEELPSTHATLWQQAEQEALPHGYTIVARYQSAGRGQGDNNWHSQPGANILLSTLVDTSAVRTEDAFVVSMWVALALQAHLAKRGVEEVSIKWPNDIYVQDKKIAGILIQNVMGATYLVKSVVSIGLNLNQIAFPNSLPNPISLAQITGKTYDMEKEAKLLAMLLKEKAVLLNDAETLSRKYQRLLYKAHEWHYYADARGRFEGKIVGVMPWGHLVVQDKAGEKRSYDMKEIQFLPDKSL